MYVNTQAVTVNMNNIIGSSELTNNGEIKNILNSAMRGQRI